MYTHDISNRNDVIDSRDVIERLSELESERQDLMDAVQEVKDNLTAFNEHPGLDETLQNLNDALESATQELATWDGDNKEEFESLIRLVAEGENLSDWEDGVALIRESHFTDYCQELLQDIGDLPKNIPHYVVIDWEATAKNLLHDYTTIEWDGVTYYAR